MNDTVPMENGGCSPTGCGCGQKCRVPLDDHQGRATGLIQELLKLLPGTGLFLLGLGGEHVFPWIPFWLAAGLYLAAYVLIGREVLIKAGRSLLHRGLFDEFVLMGLATLGALALGAYAEAVAVMLFYNLGETFQDNAVQSSRQSVASLLQLRPDTARVMDGQEVRVVDPAQVQVGQVLHVYPGERIPLDGTVLTGRSQVDTSALTGESLARDLSPGDCLLSGMVNMSGVLTMRVDKPLAESTVSVILDLVNNAAQRKAPTEQFMTRVARIYTPVVVALSAAIAFGPSLLYHLPWGFELPASPPLLSEWVYRGLVFLVISCPCALVISIPLGFFAGIGAGSRQGILIKGANFLEGLTRIKTVVWDKTGTLTQGRFAVHAVQAEQGFSQEEVLRLAAAGEQHSSHPIARAIVQAGGRQRTGVGRQRTEEGENGAAIDVQEFSGQGVLARVEGRHVAVGTAEFMRSQGVSVSRTNAQGPVVLVAVDGQHAGMILLQDTLRPQAGEAVEQLRRLGVAKQFMLTGDRHSVAEHIGHSLDLDGVEAELLPQDKVRVLERLMAEHGSQGLTAYVGDGINDAPVLARSDIGVGMGGLGSDAAIEAADIVLMQDNPSMLAKAMQLAWRTRRIIWQNIGLALGVKAGVLALGAVGLASMWAAVFADVGVALLAVGNSCRILQTRN